MDVELALSDQRRFRTVSWEYLEPEEREVMGGRGYNPA
jgi:hypothetical protein